MTNFASNIDHVAKLDNSLAMSLALTIDNVVLKAGSTYDVSTTVSIYNRTTSVTEHKTITGTLNTTDIDTYLTSIKTQLELAYPVTISHSTSIGVNSVSISNIINVGLVVNTSGYYVRGMVMNISLSGVQQYSIEATLVSPLEITPKIFGLTDDQFVSMNAVVDDFVNINNVSNDISNINIVALNTQNINTVASVQNIENITTVAASISNVNATGSNIVNVNTVAANTIPINIVSANDSAIKYVAANNSTIDSIGTQIIPNIDEILLAPMNAATATAQAGIATAQASSASASAASALDSLNILNAAYTASDLLTKIKTVDGTGSGLDSDLLEGMQPLALPISTATQTALDSKIPLTQQGIANGVATLDANGLVVATQLPPVFSSTVYSVAGRTGAVTLVKSDVGLGSADNTSDISKPISTATQTSLDLKAPLNSPTLTGIPIAPTATAGTNTTQLATTEFVLANSVQSTEYATSTVGGTIMMRISGSTLYIRNDGTNA
jgi:hypothetical protein